MKRGDSRVQLQRLHDTNGDANEKQTQSATRWYHRETTGYCKLQARVSQGHAGRAEGGKGRQVGNT